MIKRIGALGAVGIVLILAAWLVSHPSANHQAIRTNGPLTIHLLGSTVGTNQLESSQLEGLPQWVSKTSSPASTGLTNLRIVQITNTRKQPLELVGYNSASPSYDFYIHGPKGLERLSPEIPSNRPLMKLKLGPNESMLFPVVPPETDIPWQVSVSYNDYIAPVTAMPTAPTRVDKMVESVREFVPFLRKRPVQFYWVMSESVTNGKQTNSAR
jgi:hypothetical protein